MLSWLCLGLDSLDTLNLRQEGQQHFMDLGGRFHVVAVEVKP